MFGRAAGGSVVGEVNVVGAGSEVEGSVTLVLGVVVVFGKGLVSLSFGCVGAVLVFSLALVGLVVFAILGTSTVGMGSS